MVSQAQQTVDEILAHALATGGTVARAAKTAGISESAVYHRLREPTFQVRVSEIRAVIADAVVGTITDRMMGACDTLYRLLASNSETVQIRAAKTLIELAMKLNCRNNLAGHHAPDEQPREEPECFSSAVLDAPAAVPEPLDPVRPPPDGLPTPPAPGPESDVEQEKRPDEPDTDREPVISPGNGVPVGPARDSRLIDPSPVRHASGEGDGMGKSDWNLSNPVKDCHGQAGSPPMNQAHRLSTGLKVALERVGSEPA
ncbi:MAG: hypothetical protein JWO38_4485 [Gemmataceae bacterium]|nr:hypothetical protein [Gemmataceae bacterium]